MKCGKRQSVGVMDGGRCAVESNASADMRIKRINTVVMARWGVGESAVVIVHHMQDL